MRKPDFWVSLVVAIIALLASILWVPSSFTGVNILIWNVFVTILSGFLAYIIPPWVKRLILPPKEEVGTTFVIKHNAKSFIELFLKSPEEEIIFNVRVSEWVRLLTAAVKKINSAGEWFATYTLPIGLWKELGPLTNDYNNALKNKKVITKTRCIIQPIKLIENNSVYDSELIEDTKEAKITPLVVSKEKFEDFKRSKIKFEDFELFDEKFVIKVYKLPKFKKLKQKSIINVKLAKGQMISQYISYKDKLKRQKNLYDGSLVKKNEG